MPTLPVEIKEPVPEVAVEVPQFPMSATKFAQTLEGTPDEVWSRMLIVNNRAKNRTLNQWQTILDQAKGVT
jgi:hypothetical protein